MFIGDGKHYVAHDLHPAVKLAPFHSTLLWTSVSDREPCSSTRELFLE